VLLSCREDKSLVQRVGERGRHRDLNEKVCRGERGATIKNEENNGVKKGLKKGI